MTLRSFKPVTVQGHIDAAHQLLLQVPQDLPAGEVIVTISPATSASIEVSESLVELIDRMSQCARLRGQEDDAVEARIRAEREGWDG